MKILGLDIGTYTVKMVQVDSSFGRIELADYAVEPVAPVKAEVEPKKENANPEDAKNQAEPIRVVLNEEQIDAIKVLLATKLPKFEKLVVTFPKHMVTTRVYHFPTRDRKTIQSSLQFELEDDIPFDMEEIFYDFSILNSEASSSTVFAAVILKKDLVAFISQLQILGLDPDMITIESWALGSLLKRSVPDEYKSRPICIINIGHEHSSIQMYIEENPVLCHVSSAAGNSVTNTLIESYHLPKDQADQIKIDSSFLVTETHLERTPDEITEDQRVFSATIGRALAPLIYDIKQTLMSFKSSNKLTPKAIFLTGSSTLIPNLPLYLEEHLRIPVFQLTYMSKIVGQTLALSESTEALISSATGLALSTIKVERNLTINFRKDEYAKRGGMGALDWKTYKKPLQYVAASLVFVYLNLFVQGLILNSRSSTQEERLERAVKSVFGGTSQSTLRTYISSPSTLKHAVEKETAKHRPVAAAPPKKIISAFDVLNKVSQNIPRDLTVDVNLFEIKDGSLKLLGIAERLNSPDRILKALEETKLFTDLNKVKAQEDVKTKKVSFEIQAKVSENSNGQTR
ncbi:MAG: pilus assembly protein PilM [Bacteriovoracia bacterium]